MNEIKDRSKDVRRTAGEFGSTVADKAREASSTASDYAREGMERAREMGHSAKEMARNAYDRTAEAARYASDEMETVIRRYPFSSVLTVLGVGMAVGLLIGASMRQKSCY